ncbi:MAG TPA: hypothetical protein VFQ07_08535 [Candidatus Polarisedimenticolia bacterium]|nr:hypothetical protein [Candidatus Polarisedimenticolia bacterium]
MDAISMSATPWWPGAMALALAVLALLAGLTRDEARREFRGANFALVAAVAIGIAAVVFAVGVR